MDHQQIRDLLTHEAYPEPTETVSLHQTHVSLLFMTDRYVYKVKKAVNFGFLDFTTLEKRLFFCHEEVRLNRRLAPDIYLKVVPLVQSDGGVRMEGRGKPFEYAVKMVRLPADRMMERLLDTGGVTDAAMRELARRIARFHEAAEWSSAIAAYGEPAAVWRNWEDNFAQAEQFRDVTISSREFDLIREFAVRFMKEQGALLASRVAEGYIRDCDGDLHSGNICLDKQIHIFDCIEFNERFRCIDTAADIAFLLMDLDEHRQSRLGEIFMEEYLSLTNDREMPRLLPFYKAQRAFIRGKVESLRLNDPEIALRDKEEAKIRAGRYFLLARSYAVAGKLPRTLFITCGLPGTGKSTCADELSYQLRVPVLTADRVRKELAGLAAMDHGGAAEGIYTPAATRKTYDTLRTRALQILQQGGSVIIDATFRDKGERNRFRTLAEEEGVPLVILVTTCPEEVARQRLDDRAADPTAISDGRYEQYLRQKGEFAPLSPEEGRVIMVDTGEEISRAVERIIEQLGILSPSS